MAVLRSLVTTLGLNAASFREGLRRSREDMGSFADKVKAGAAASAKAIAGIAAVTVTLATGLAGIASGALISRLKETYQSLDEIGETGRNLGLSAKQWDIWRQAAEWAGSSGEKVADVIKDLNVKITEAAKTDGGALKDFFTQINQKAADWAKLSPDQQIVKFSEQISKMPDNEALFWLDEINDSAAELKDSLVSGQFFKFSKEIDTLGLSLTSVQFTQIHEARMEFSKLESLMGGTWKQVQVAAAPAISIITSGINDWIINAAKARGGFQQLGKDIALFIIEGIEKASDAIYDFVNFTNSRFRKARLTSGFGVSKEERQTYLDGEDRLNEVIQARVQLQNEYKKAGKETYDGQLNQIARLVSLEKDLEDQREKQLREGGADETYKKWKEGLAAAKKAIEEQSGKDANVTPPGALRKFGSEEIGDPKKTNAAVEAFKKLRIEIESANATSLQKIDMQETEARLKIIKEGAAAGASQQAIFEVAAASSRRFAKERQDLVDQYSPISKIKHQEEEVTELLKQMQSRRLIDFQTYQSAISKQQIESFRAIAQEKAQQTVAPIEQIRADVDPVAQYQNEYTQRLSILESYQEQERTMQDEARQSGKISEEAYQQSLLEITERYARLRSDAEKSRMTQISDYQNQDTMKQLAAQQSLFDGMAGLAESYAGRSSGAYRALFAASKGFQIAQTLLASKAAIAMAWASAPFPANIPAVALAVGQTGVLTAAAQAVTMSGQAHDGIDYVPREGTWLLDRGERVVDARTNADLKKYLSAPSQSGNAGSSSTPQQNQFSFDQTFQVNGNPDDRTIQMMKEETRKAALQAFNMVASSLATGQGKVHKSLVAGYATKRRVE